jgi:hypothetical protein
MGKLFICFLAVIGGIFLITSYCPSMWVKQLFIGQFHCSYAFLMLLGLGYMLLHISVGKKG